jgi:hypothetical protein
MGGPGVSGLGMDPAGIDELQQAMHVQLQNQAQMLA